MPLAARIVQLQKFPENPRTPRQKYDHERKTLRKNVHQKLPAKSPRPLLPTPTRRVKPGGQSVFKERIKLFFLFVGFKFQLRSKLNIIYLRVLIIKINNRQLSQFDFCVGIKFFQKRSLIEIFYRNPIPVFPFKKKNILTLCRF